MSIKSNRKFSREELGNILLQRGTAVGMLALILILGIRAPAFFEFNNLMDVLKQSCVLTFVALSQTVILIAGGFDMSAGALLQLTANLAAGFVVAGHNTLTVLAIGLAVGLLVGVINAFWVVNVRIPPFVATLGMMLIMNGATLYYNRGRAITLYGAQDFFYIGQGYVGVVPFLFIVLIVVLVVLNVFLKRTAIGMHMYAVGENDQAAQLHGIDRKKALYVAFILGGALVGITGVFQASYNYGASAVGTGMDFLMSALAAALLGTTYSKTGELSVIGTSISAIFISSLSNGLIVNGVSNLLQPGLLGIILVASVLLTVIKKREIGQITIF